MSTFIHHGAVDGVTGSCHQLVLSDGQSVLVDCGLFQGAETAHDGSGARNLAIHFPLERVRALVVSHVHIDHVGRIPYLLAAGYTGPIVCSQASAALLPLVLEDAVKVGMTLSHGPSTEQLLAQIRRQVVAVPYKQWRTILSGRHELRVRLSPAGHILGSAYVEFDIRQGADRQRIVFSGDLGAPWTPLLPAPRSPYAADIVVLESTYGDRLHESRKDRRQRLQALCEHAFGNGGSILIPAFSIGRTQELLYEIEEIIHRNRQRPAAPGVDWQDLDIIVDSPLAADFTAGYMRLREHWDSEARRKLAAGRHPLDFAQLTTIDDHASHLRTVDFLARSGRPAIVIAASGMCSGGRIVSYLKAMLGDPRHDVLFTGYQAAGTPGRIIQKFGPGGGHVELDGQRHDIRAGVHTLGGYSAHADQKDLLNFIGRMRGRPRQIRLVHGENGAKQALAAALTRLHPEIEVLIP
ncbi:MBL fold metallo-hydrolase RNA specificity domain-containing protein [Accumulibacter sp.]|uniref:MBL fold metallo-hydrolase RNA specificity domain-containing protein n=1 Tax=Accumulibacter sp. TaxID=2053492 RepID=UPI0025FC107D|nr:MBL fold metallo-hydrolase [Accumulibacter sp.]MCM8595714.1 MBL fold metallo-hydrolase [Accumulibacter sp.]MCM8624905.1 MBL fold metallo-hydrolase [Accumulibacter sp.]MDS4049861.1 MBL fold metallo-hydrolase [Accumulibacter sp.]